MWEILPPAVSRRSGACVHMKQAGSAETEKRPTKIPSVREFLREFQKKTTQLPVQIKGLE